MWCFQLVRREPHSLCNLAVSLQGNDKISRDKQMRCIGSHQHNFYSVVINCIIAQLSFQQAFHELLFSLGIFFSYRRMERLCLYWSKVSYWIANGRRRWRSASQKVRNPCCHLHMMCNDPCAKREWLISQELNNFIYDRILYRLEMMITVAFIGYGLACCNKRIGK